MASPLDIDVVTIFPGLLEGILGESILKRAIDAGVVRVNTIDPRVFTRDPHRSVDDRPYGGGPGMVMKPEPLFEAVESVQRDGSRVLLMTPQGRPYRQDMAGELAGASHLILVCGHYEGVDERIRKALVTEEISIGDYVLTNGVLPAAVVIDSVVRLLPGVLGAGPEAHQDESFSQGLLEYPHYTRPPEYRGMEVPEILRSGDHPAIAAWRKAQSVARTQKRRPDLFRENS